MSNTQPFVSSRFRAFDLNGNPLSGGKLYTYAAGTTTPLATYTTRAGTIANANPVVLDGDGEADVWLASGTAYKFSLYDSSGVLQNTVDNWPSPVDTSASTVAVTDPGGRLTLTQASPVTPADVTGATTIYYVPYKSDTVPLYDGVSAWTLNSIGSGGLSQTTTDATKSPAAVAINSNYDLFVWSDAGTLRLSRGPAWTSDTARGTGAGTTELTRVNGRMLNANAITNGPAAQRGLYVGTVRSDGSAHVNDSAAKRHVWNMYGRAKRSMVVAEAASSWSYSGGFYGIYRQANANAANQLDMVRGMDEDVAEASVLVQASGTATGALQMVGVGIDSTTVNSAQVQANAYGNVLQLNASATYVGCPGLGRHALKWIEAVTAGSGGSTGLFQGHDAASGNAAAIFGSVLA